MERGSLIFRTVVVAVVVTVFACSMHPLVQRDYYEVFLGMVRQDQPKKLEYVPVTDPNSVVKGCHVQMSDGIEGIVDEVGDNSVTILIKTGEMKVDKKGIAKIRVDGALVAAAKQLKQDNAALYPSQALEKAAEQRGVDLKEIVNVKGDIQNNRDVLSLVRKNASGSIRLGLDLNGGVEFYLKLVELDNLEPERKQAIERDFDRYRDVAIEILRKRLEAEKIFEAEIAPSGDRHVALRAPVVANDEKAKLLSLIKMSAQLEFRLVHPNSAELIEVAREEFKRKNPGADPKAEYQYLEKMAPRGYKFMSVAEKENNRTAIRNYYIADKVEMDGKNIAMAYPDKDQWGQRQISLRFNSRGATDFARVTGRNVGRQLAIVLDGKLYCAPVIQNKIPGGNAVINGSFSEDEVKAIADALISGNFPFKVEVDAVFDTAPTLGEANVKTGIWVGIFSLVCVALFMIVYYRLCGVISVAALCLNVVLIMGAMAAFDCTLTLPGIAGIILTIGMAVDANVLVYERIREELANGNKLRTAVEMGYSRAFSAVFDANVTTLLTSFILMYIGTGAVKGFGVTLSIGILSTLFTALFVTRLIFDYILKFTSLEHISMLQIFKKAKYPFMKIFPWALLVSVILVLALAGTLAFRGKSVLGVDFTGGTNMTFGYKKEIPKDDIVKFLRARKYDDPGVNYKIDSLNGEKKLEITVRGKLKPGAGVELEDALTKRFPDAKLIPAGESSVGGLIGREFIKAALIAIALSLVGIGIYISLRYEFIYAVSGVLMLLHDVAVVLAIYLMTGRRLSLTAIAALLTVIGYSINDNVVIFDRMRENLKLGVSKDFGVIASLSVNQTLSRTIITSITTFIVVFIQFIAGGAAINDFVFIMMLGVVLGTYSSVFLAAPTVAFLRGSGDGQAQQYRKAEEIKC